MHPDTWELPFLAVWALLYVVVLCRAGGTYALGRLARSGAARVRSLERLFATERYRRVEATLDRWGAPLVAVSFLTVGIQTLVNAAAGAGRMSLWRYLPALAVGGAAWALIYAAVGFVGVAAVASAYARWPVATIVVTALLVLLLVGFIAVRVLGRRQTIGADATLD